MSHLVRLGTALLAAALLLVSGVARAWVEVRVTANEARVTLDRDGKARVEHRVTLKIAGGPLKSYDIRAVDEDAKVEPGGWVALAKDVQQGSLASAIPIDVELTRERRVGGAAVDLEPVARIRFGDKGIGRGTWVVSFAYATDLMAAGAIDIDGSLAHLRWRGPAFDDGFESARATFVLPGAPTEPRVDDAGAHDDTGDPEPNAPTFLSTLKRTPSGDELALLRPYAPKGERIAWPVLADARAFGRREVEPPAPTVWVPPALGEANGRTLLFAGGAGLFFLYAFLLVLKSREVARGARAAGVEPSPLVPLPLFVRASVGGLALALGVALELVFDRASAGAVLVVLASALAAHRTPRWHHAARGPGRWLPVTAREAFEDLPRPRGAWLDVSTRGGKVLFVLAIGALAGASAWTFRSSPDHAALVALDVPVLLALFCTGRLRELPPDAVAGRAPLLRAVAARLPKHLPRDQRENVRIVPRIRVPLASADADELRLLVTPRRPVRGFGGIEIGVVFVPGAGGAIAMPEVLVRYTLGSECELALGPAARLGRVLRGRRPDERVLLLAPRLPTARMTAAIAAALAVRTFARDEAGAFAEHTPAPKKQERKPKPSARAAA